MPPTPRISDSVDVKIRLPGAMQKEAASLARESGLSMAGLVRLAAMTGWPAVRQTLAMAHDAPKADNKPHEVTHAP